jgi:hypothetical protein
MILDLTLSGFYSWKMIRWDDGSTVLVSEKTKVIAY